MLRPRAARRGRPPRALVALAVLAAAVTGVAGCASAGEPVGAGRTAPASAPSRLWPQAAPAPSPSGPQHDGETATKVPGVPPVPSGDIRKVDAYALVKAEVAANRKSVTGADALDDTTAAKVASSCSAARRTNCPMREPVYSDLTGDGHDDLIVGIEMEDHFLSLRAYTLVNGEPTRVLSTVAQPSSIEVAGRDLIVWEPWTTPHYALRSVYTWNAQSHYMDFRRYEIRRAEAPASSGTQHEREGHR
ncbi:hypothetical protein [Streptomyces sp. NPDC008001]|uniref:hypothetical protein n=1 Tax=Streptomyces sp. NPDC008001 TaxID=3364804 RepID=UPI0036EEE7A3